MTFPDGKKYVGEWKNGTPNGKGTETIPNVSINENQWQDATSSQ